jgi:hypothetical protein
MQVVLTSLPTLLTRDFALRDARPVINGQVWTDAETHTQSATQIAFTSPSAPGVTFTLVHETDSAERVVWRWWVEGVEPTQLDSFGLRFNAVENLRAYLCNGYMSWDAGQYVEPESLADFEPYERRPTVGYAMTQLLPRFGSGSLIMGFDRHDRFQQSFTFDVSANPTTLTILTHWDRKNLTPQPPLPRAVPSSGDDAGEGEPSVGMPIMASADSDTTRCESERLYIFEHDGVEDALRAWAEIVATASVMLPRPAKQPITGWCSWYDQYGYITEATILDYLAGAKQVVEREQIPMRVFQIDDGFTPEMGDWMTVSPKFPRGMKFIMDEIRTAGFVPGLWIAPFIVGNRSKLYQEHPDWVVQDAVNGGPLIEWFTYGENRWFKMSEEGYILDATHPEAFEYIRQCFRAWRQEWGCDYFKIDFYYWGAHYGPDRAKWHTPGLTRVEIWRRFSEMIRQEIGDSTWLACGAPLWASIGLVDGVRIGGDVGVTWTGGNSAASLLRDQATRNFGNQLLWQIDPDCIFLREKFHYLTDAEIEALAIYAGMAGGVTMTSDYLPALSQRRLDLWRFLLAGNTEPRQCRYPLLGQSGLVYDRLPDPKDPRKVRHEARATDPVIVQVREHDGLAAVFVFNVGDRPAERSYPLTLLGLPGCLHGYDWSRDTALGEVERVSVALAPHEGRLIYLSAEPITTRPGRLP